MSGLNQRFDETIRLLDLCYPDAERWYRKKHNLMPDAPFHGKEAVIVWLEFMTEFWNVFEKNKRTIKKQNFNKESSS